MTDDVTVSMPYSGVFVQEVAQVLEEVAPCIPAKQRATVCRHILDTLYNEGMLAESPWKTKAASWLRRAMTAERQRDKANSRAALAEHNKSWMHVKTQLELDQALVVVRAAEEWRAILPSDDPDEHMRKHNALLSAVDAWLLLSYEDQDDGTDLDGDVPASDAKASEPAEIETDVKQTDAEPEPAVES